MEYFKGPKLPPSPNIPHARAHPQTHLQTQTKGWGPSLSHVHRSECKGYKKVGVYHRGTQTDREKDMHAFGAAPLAAGTRSLRGRGLSGVTLARPGRGVAPSVLPNSSGHPCGTSLVAPAAGELRRSRPALRPARSPPGAHPREPHEAARAPAGRSCARGGSPPPWTPACSGHAETRWNCRRAWRPTLILRLP